MTDTTSTTTGDPGTGDLGKYLPGQDGSKFKTVEELARAKAESDRFIDDLKRENAETRAALRELETSLNKAKGVDDVLAALAGMQNGSGVGGRADTGTFRSSGQDGSGNQSNASAEDPSQSARVKELVQQLLVERDTQVVQDSNWSKVQNLFLGKHHNDPDEAVLGMRATARELGMSFDEFQGIARKNPNLVLRAAGLTQGQNTGANDPMRFAGGNSGSSDTGPPTGPIKNESYYRKLRQDMRAQGKLAKYYTPKIQQEIMESAKQLGDRFFS